MQMTPKQCAAARVWLGLTREQLAERAEVARNTIVRFENGENLRGSTKKVLSFTFRELGIEFPNEGTIVYRERQDG